MIRFPVTSGWLPRQFGEEALGFIQGGPHGVGLLSMGTHKGPVLRSNHRDSEWQCEETASKTDCAASSH